MTDQPGHRGAPVGNAQGDTPAEISPDNPPPQRPAQSDLGASPQDIIAWNAPTPQDATDE